MANLNFDTPEGQAEYIQAQFIIRLANSRGYCTSNSPLTERTRAFFDLMTDYQTFQDMQGSQETQVDIARRLLQHSIPQYKRVVPKDLQKLLRLDVEKLEELCDEISRESVRINL